MKCSAFVGISLDGFVARMNGSIDFLTSDAWEQSEDYGYSDFLASVDVLVWGRHTYQKVKAFEPKPLFDKPIIVLSSKQIDLWNCSSKSLEVLSCSPSELVNRMAQRKFNHLYIDGGQTIQRFLASGLLNSLIITRLPILIGEGIPLFASHENDVYLRHIRTQSFTSGFVQSEYDIQYRSL